MNTLLDGFKTISLAELNQVSMLQRVDSKFVLRQQTLPRFLDSISHDYRLLTIDGCQCFGYHTIYYDTAEFALYHQHHNGKMPRYKVRSRQYLQGGQCFDEVKRKNNKGKTFKYRSRRQSLTTRSDTTFIDFVNRHVPLDATHLQAVLTVFYDRMTFADNALSERMTIDTNIRFGIDAVQAGLPELAIVELKQDLATAGSIARLSLRDLRIKRTSCSKYCLGVASCYQEVKINRFKSKLHYLDKVSHPV